MSVILLLAMSVCCAHRSPQPRDASGRPGNSITIKGSDTMVLLAQWWVENYLESHPHLIIQVNGGGSGGGIAALLNGTTDICQSSRVSAPGCETKSERDVGTVQGAVAVAN